MSNKSPIFPMPAEPHHFNDYGFDPQIHFSHVLEESRKHQNSIHSLHFKLQKPISKEDHYSKKTNHQKAKMNKYWWWRNAVSFFNWKKWTPNDQADGDRAKTKKALRGSISGPVYMTEPSRSGSTTPGRISSRSSSGPLAGISTPYHSLTELNMEEQQQQQQLHRVSTSSLPIYLVT